MSQAGRELGDAFLDEAVAELNTWTTQMSKDILVLIEICCESGSALGNIDNMQPNVLVIRVLT